MWISLLVHILMMIIVKDSLEIFYHGDVADYDEDKNKDEIIIEELWITPRGLKNDLSAPAEDIR